MGAVLLTWYLLATTAGLIAWPLLYRLLPGLPDRGFSLARVAGLLLIGYLFWLGGSLGLLANEPGSATLAAAILLGLGLWFYGKRREDVPGMLAWLRTHRGAALTSELVFVLAFAAWLIVRSYNPEILGTEKPMELAFLNGVRGSAVFPPRDPWLSGYAISYYYFGYVIVGMLADLSGVASEVAFNAGIALLLALTCQAAYGIALNLLLAARADGEPLNAPVGALLAPFFVAIAGNLQGLLELLRGLLLLPASVLAWFDIEDISTPLTTVTWPPDRYLWWWRASRVIQDRDIAGVSIGLQPIDEFPMFSFVLGDMHPHVLALPFALGALALAFNAMRQRELLRLPQMLTYAVYFGGLAFLNAWDLPIYGFVLLLAMLLQSARTEGNLPWQSAGRVALRWLAIIAGGLLLYLPWILSFSSQAGGILPNPVFATRFHQFAVMFAVPLLLIIALLIKEIATHHSDLDWSLGWIVAVGLLLTLIVMLAGLSLIALDVEPYATIFLLSSTGVNVAGLDADQLSILVPGALRQVVMHRISRPVTPLFLTLLIAAAVALLGRWLPRVDEPRDTESGQSTAFVLLLVITGAMLTLGPEFLYLRDNFGQRINTIFKFYYAGWVLWGVAASYAAAKLMAARRPGWRIASGVLTLLLLAASLIYPAFAIPTRTNNFGADSLDGPTLDGLAWLRNSNPDDYAAIQWLRANADPDEVLVEAVGGAYSYYGRISASTGLPTVMGWSNHERQWRGDLYDEVAGGREEAVREIYNSPSIDRALDLLRQYGVTYIYVGGLERDPGFASLAGIAKFEQYLTAVYRSGGVAIYRVDLPRVEEEP